MRTVFSLMIAATAVFGIACQAHAQQGFKPVPLIERPGAKVHDIDLAQGTDVQVNLQVVTACVDGNATFKITNVGDAWPRLGTLKVMKITDAGVEPLVQRQMRFVAGQGASFRFRQAVGDRIALFVDPSWYERPFKFDAMVACDGQRSN